MRRLLSIATALIMGVTLPTVSHAAVTKLMFTQENGAPLSGIPTVSAGESLHFVLANFPTGSGLYIYQAVQPKNAGSKPSQANTSQSAAIWISANSQASFAPDKVITFKVDNGNAWGADCAHQQCGLWLEYDFNKSADRSEDQFVPFNFSAVSTAPTPTSSPMSSNLTPDSLDVKINGVQAKENTISAIFYRQVLTFSATSSSGVPVTFISYTPDLCPVSGNTVTALKGAGQCDIAAVSVGNANFGPKKSHFPFNVGLGVQTANVGHIGFKVKVGATWTEAKTTNFGETITYKALTKNCSIKGFTFKALKVGACKIVASAPATSNYAAFSATDSFVISKK